MTACQRAVANKQIPKREALKGKLFSKNMAVVNHFSIAPV